MSDAPAPPAGYYEDGDGRRRWWDGAAWTDGDASAGVAGPAAGTLSDAEQRRALDLAVSKYVEHGYSLKSHTGTRAVVARRQRVHVGLNLVMTAVTGGFWLVFLAIRLLNWPTDRVVLTIDRYGVLTPEFS